MSEENKALVRRQEELFGGGNLDLADEIYAPDYVGHDPSNPGDVRGLQAAKQAASDYRQAFPDLRVTLPAVSGCSALSGVKSGVKWYRPVWFVF